MKKILCSMFLVVLMLLGAANCLAAEEETYLIYTNNDFENHKIGDKPGVFVMHETSGYGFYAEEESRLEAFHNTEIVNIEKNGNSKNRAVKLNPDLNAAEYDVYTHPDGRNWDTISKLRAIFAYYPIKENGVISFSFRVADATKSKSVRFGRNAIMSKHINFVHNHKPGYEDDRYIASNWSSFFSISNGKAYYTGNGTVELGAISADTWYDVDFVVDITAGTGKIYFGGKSFSVLLPSNTVNIYEVRFDLTNTVGDVWYIDDFRIYEADGLVGDSVLDAQWKKYTESSFYGGYEFESARQTNYDYMAFLKCDGKKFSVINTNRIFDGSRVMTMGATIHYNKEGVLMAPVYDMAKALGATVSVDSSTQSLTMELDGKILTVTPGEKSYYSDGKKSVLIYPVEVIDNVACMQIDVLLNFFGKTYTLQDDILWIDQPAEFDWSMPLDVNGKELEGTGNISLDDNIYQRILRMFLYDRPTDAEIAAAMKAVHPRIEFTAESVAQIKEKMKTDTRLAKAVKRITDIADEMVNDATTTNEAGETVLKYPDFTYSLRNGRNISYGGAGEYFETLAFAYMMSDIETDKAAYKNEILHHLSYLGDPNIFPDFHIYQASGLGTGTIAYGLAYAIDWVDWTEDEIAMIEDMCRRNILDQALHVYTCSLNTFHHGITFGQGNQALITNGGFLLLASSLYERDPEYYQDIIRGALRATEGGTIVYFPNGEYEEGISYWRYASDFLAQMAKGLQTSMNTDWGITDVPGVLKTAEFPFMMKGAVKSYAFGDGVSENPIAPLLMFAASQTDNKALAEYRKQNSVTLKPTIVDVANWVDTTNEDYQGLDVYDHDIYNVLNSTVVMKTGWDSSDTTVAFHGGANNDGHGHCDIGTFQFDMLGAQFGIDLVRENYELRDYGAYNIADVAKNYPTDIYPNGSPFSGAHYYRFKGEGHNTVVANRSIINSKKIYGEDGICNYDMAGTYDMNTTAKSYFTDMVFGDDQSFAVLNMTETNDIYECAVRGIKLDKTNDIIYIQDDFRASVPTDFLWSLHTYTQVEVAEDGKSAILSTSNGKKVKATIVYDNNCDLKFEVLSAAFDTTYGSDLKPLVESPNTVAENKVNAKKHGIATDISSDARKLAVRTPVGENITRFKLAVAIQPYDSAATPEYTPIETWEDKQ